MQQVSLLLSSQFIVNPTETWVLNNSVDVALLLHTVIYRTAKTLYYCREWFPLFNGETYHSYYHCIQVSYKSSLQYRLYSDSAKMHLASLVDVNALFNGTILIRICSFSSTAPRLCRPFISSSSFCDTCLVYM